eukprot:962752_1
MSDEKRDSLKRKHDSIKGDDAAGAAEKKPKGGKCCAEEHKSTLEYLEKHWVGTSAKMADRGEILENWPGTADGKVDAEQHQKLVTHMDEAHATQKEFIDEMEKKSAEFRAHLAEACDASSDCFKEKWAAFDEKVKELRKKATTELDVMDNKFHKIMREYPEHDDDAKSFKDKSIEYWSGKMGEIKDAFKRLSLVFGEDEKNDEKKEDEKKEEKKEK